MQTNHPPSPTASPSRQSRSYPRRSLGIGLIEMMAILPIIAVAGLLVATVVTSSLRLHRETEQRIVQIDRFNDMIEQIRADLQHADDVQLSADRQLTLRLDGAEISYHFLNELIWSRQVNQQETHRWPLPLSSFPITLHQPAETMILIDGGQRGGTIPLAIPGAMRP